MIENEISYSDRGYDKIDPFFVELPNNGNDCSSKEVRHKTAVVDVSTEEEWDRDEDPRSVSKKSDTAKPILQCEMSSCKPEEIVTYSEVIEIEYHFLI